MQLKEYLKSMLQQALSRMARFISHALAGVRDFMHLILGHLRRSRSYIRRTWPGKDPVASSTSEAVYVHFDRHGVIHDFVLEQLRQLVEAGFRITFVSNSPKFDEQSVALIARYCRQILWRRNVGYDFGAYKDGIAAVGDLDRVARLVLMNDSVYGPFFPLTSVLAAADPSRTDVWGITDSWEHRYHIQSYFILFLEGALRSPAFRRFWRRFPYVNRKNWIIINGEIKLTQVLTQSKLRASVLNPYWQIAKAVLDKLEHRTDDLPSAHEAFLARMHGLLVRGRPMNQSHFFWDTLVTDFRCPFLKREVILINPAGLPFHWRWNEVISRESDYDIGLIMRHLQAS
jgi:lipopolysaccharide biosynthesis protein